MSDLGNVIKEGSKCAIYTHNEDIAYVLKYIKKISKKKYKVDAKTYNYILNKKRTISGIFIVLNENKIKFCDIPQKVEKHKLYVWNKRGGDKYA